MVPYKCIRSADRLLRSAASELSTLPALSARGTPQMEVGSLVLLPGNIAACTIKLVSKQSENIDVTLQASVAFHIIFPFRMICDNLFCVNLISNIIGREAFGSDFQRVRQLLDTLCIGLSPSITLSGFHALVPVLTIGVVPMGYEESFWSGLLLDSSIMSAVCVALAMKTVHAFADIIKQRKELAKITCNRECFIADLKDLRRNRDRIVAALLKPAAVAAIAAILNIPCLFVPVIRANRSHVVAFQTVVATIKPP
eukprot:616068-Pleurochrysis_carterae.AAC.1